jgi:hypothetical protein
MAGEQHRARAYTALVPAAIVGNADNTLIQLPITDIDVINEAKVSDASVT